MDAERTTGLAEIGLLPPARIKRTGPIIGQDTKCVLRAFAGYDDARAMLSEAGGPR